MKDILAIILTVLGIGLLNDFGPLTTPDLVGAFVLCAALALTRVA